MSRYYNEFEPRKDVLAKFDKWKSDVEKARMRWISESVRNNIKSSYGVHLMLDVDWREIPVEYWRE